MRELSPDEQIKKENAELRQENAELRKKIEELQEKSQHDFLTGLYNRDFFQQQAGKKVDQINKPFSDERRERGALKDVAVIFIDVDNFKWINDEFGHEAGDRVLREVAEALKSSVRGDKDVAARIGGEEFAVLMSDTTEEMARKKAEDLLKQISRRTTMQMGSNLSDPFISVEASMGVAEFKKGENLSDFISRSDKAMYIAKESGKNQVVAFSEIPEQESAEND